MEKKTALVVGGTSGLGLQLALQLAETHQVIVTGHNRPEDRRLDFRELHLSGSRDAREDLHEMVSQLPFIDLLIYSAGFLEEGTLTDMDEEGMDLLLYTGLGSPALLLRDLLRKQDRLPGFIAITSTAQWTPRRLESMYTAVKAGLAMFAQSISLDGRVEKTMVAGPGGMNTPFWSKSKRDASAMLDPKWVAEQILKEYLGTYAYKCIKIPRDPARVEVIETR